MTISRDDWMTALTEAGFAVRGEDDQDALTLKEFVAMVGLSRTTAQARLDALIESGKAVRTWKRVYRGNGNPYRAVAYRLLP